MVTSFGGFGSGMGFLLLVMKDFHGHGLSWAANCAKTTADALLVVLQHSGKRLSKLQIGVLQDLLLSLRIDVQFLQRHQLHAIFMTDIHTPVAQNTFVRVVDSLNVTIETALSLASGFLLAKTGFHLGDSSPSIKGERWRRLAVTSLIVFRH